ncbi:Bifunctional protein PyrR [Xenorhabdus stockiae]|uniref:Bifunctional protein PyrR n=1 Tax=Xenorhabdus stockiae TaxID=351614 RepID=A0A2D0KN73_9GAMM|nr:Bifunctional protein PyrR [Xenorhabdus stockiae]
MCFFGFAIKKFAKIGLSFFDSPIILKSYLGYALDKHSVGSTFLGYNGAGHPIFDTVRTEIGQALYQLKYHNNFQYINQLSHCIVEEIVKPYFPKIGFVIPMPASNIRKVQPVSELAKQVARLINSPFFDGILLKATGGTSLKNLSNKEEKEEAIGNSFSIEDTIKNEGKWNVLLVDDLFHTGATMEAACNALSSYSKVKSIYVATLTWR